MIKVLIVDDELKARNTLHHMIIDHIPEISEVRVASSTDEAREILLDYDPDIAFLDIEMPVQNGFEFLVELRDPRFDVIFTTGHNQYAIQALRFCALDFLLKPIDPQELAEAMQRYLFKRSRVPRRKRIYENFVQNSEGKHTRDYRIAVTSNAGIFFFPLREIIRLEADRNYTVFHLTDRKKPFIASKTLKHFENILEQFKFIRTHKTHLVNAQHVIRISNGNEYLILSDGTRIEISRRKRESVLNLLNVR